MLEISRANETQVLGEMTQEVLGRWHTKCGRNGINICNIFTTFSAALCNSVWCSNMNPTLMHISWIEAHFPFFYISDVTGIQANSSSMNNLCLYCSRVWAFNWSGRAKKLHLWSQKTSIEMRKIIFIGRVPEVGGPRDRQSPKGQGPLQKEGPPKYAIISRNLVLSQFTLCL